MNIAGHTFHHIGYACQSMARDRAAFESLGYTQEGEAFDDPVQGVRGCFMVGAGPRIELLENLPGAETLSPWLAAGIRMYHQAFVVDDIEAGVAWARSQRAIVKVAPVPAVAFGGRRIAFVFMRNAMLIELIEKA